MQNRKGTGILGLSWGDDLHTSPTQCWAPVSPASAVGPQAPSLSLSAFASTLTSTPAQVLGKEIVS